MPAGELISFMTAAKWIESLARKYAKVKGERGDEITALANVFGDPVDLARFYVHPNCSIESPADRDEDDGSLQLERPLFQVLEDFFARDIKKRDGRRHLFLMADAGMGKTSALVMLRLAYINSFWPKGYECQLFKLGPETLEQITEVESQAETILLLDALDEDSRSIGAAIEKRLYELITHTKNFHRVVITCRTQFFPGKIERLGKVRIGNAYSCAALYLSPFNDGQVQQYLDKSFPRKWRAVMGSDPSYYFGGQRPNDEPVQNVSWHNAIAFCNALSKREGRTPYYAVEGEQVSERPDSDGYRLPTEAEWEYACRAGSAAAYCFGDDTEQLKHHARYNGDGRDGGPLPVKSGRPNAWGLYDMHGNVWEWAWDWYDDSYQFNDRQNPRGPKRGLTRVLRGGSFDYRSWYLRSAVRGGGQPMNHRIDVGFRCARDVFPALIRARNSGSLPAPSA